MATMRLTGRLLLTFASVPWYVPVTYQEDGRVWQKLLWQIK